MPEPEHELFAIRIIAENTKGVLRDITTVVACHDANIMMIHQEVFESGPMNKLAEIYLSLIHISEPTRPY